MPARQALTAVLRTVLPGTGSPARPVSDLAYIGRYRVTLKLRHLPELVLSDDEKPTVVITIQTT